MQAVRRSPPSPINTVRREPPYNRMTCSPAARGRQVADRPVLQTLQRQRRLPLLRRRRVRVPRVRRGRRRQDRHSRDRRAGGRARGRRAPVAAARPQGPMLGPAFPSAEGAVHANLAARKVQAVPQLLSGGHARAHRLQGAVPQGGAARALHLRGLQHQHCGPVFAALVHGAWDVLGSAALHNSLSRRHRHLHLHLRSGVRLTQPEQRQQPRHPGRS